MDVTFLGPDGCKADVIGIDLGNTVYYVDASERKPVCHFGCYALARKTEVVDCQWLRQLHTFAVLSDTFLPFHVIAGLRVLWRHRCNLVESARKTIL